MMKRFSVLAGIMLAVSAVLTGCQTGEGAASDTEKAEKVAKVVAKQAVKAAVRSAPINVIKAVK